MEFAIAEDWIWIDHRKVYDECDLYETKIPHPVFCDEEVAYSACEQIVHNMLACSGVMFPVQPWNTVFHSHRVPDVLPEHYLWKLLCKMQATRSILVVSCVYIDRFMRSTYCPVNVLTIHRLLLCATVLAHKWTEDVNFTTTTLSKFGGVHHRELNRLLSFMCHCLEWKLHVDVDCYELYACSLGLSD